MNLQKSDELIEFGEFPDFWEAEKDIPHLSKAMFHQCHFAVNPKNIYLLHALILFWKSMNMTRQVKNVRIGKYQYKFSTDEHVVFAKMKEGCDPVLST